MSDDIERYVLNLRQKGENFSNLESLIKYDFYLKKNFLDVCKTKICGKCFDEISPSSDLFMAHNCFSYHSTKSV